MPILQARSPVLEAPTVAAMPIYIRGFSMHMAITVTSTPELFAGRVARLDHLGVANMHVAFTRESDGDLTEGGQYHTGELARPEEVCDFCIPFVELELGEPRRMLFDAEPLQRHAPLAAGRYRVDVTFHRVSAAPFEITIRDPTPAEASALLGLKRLGVEWTTTLPSGKEPPQILPTDPLRFLRVLHFLYTTPTPLSEVDPSVLDVLEGFYGPEATLLRFELARLRDDKAAQERAEATIRSQYPSSVPALRELKGRGGTILRNRESYEGRPGARP